MLASCETMWTALLITLCSVGVFGTSIVYGVLNYWFRFDHTYYIIYLHFNFQVKPVVVPVMVLLGCGVQVILHLPTPLG